MRETKEHGRVYKAGWVMGLSLQSKHIRVTCAIIERNGLILAAQRSASSSMPLKWEFPGGKINKGETAEECLHRELKEELGIRVTVQRELPTSTHHYPSFTITLHPFVCTIISKNIALREHASVAWRLPQEIHSLDWAEADLPVLKAYLAEQSTNNKLMYKKSEGKI